MDRRGSAQYRATAGESQGFGATPREALEELLRRLPEGEAVSPIVIWPFNRGDAFFTDAQEKRLRELHSRRDSLSATERQELEHLVEASFEATIARTRALPRVKS